MSVCNSFMASSKILGEETLAGAHAVAVAATAAEAEALRAAEMEADGDEEKAART